MSHEKNDFVHVPVLSDECVDALSVKTEGIYIDCTVGGGGHSFQIAKRLDFLKPASALLCLDRDKQALKAANEKLKDYPVILINDNFINIKKIAIENRITGADGILMDLGVSSHQLDTGERGFSFHEDAPLDMRMSGEDGELSAFDVVNDYSAEDLIRILFNYGEEKFARGITKGIIKARENAPIKTTGQLAEIIKNNVPLKVRREKNPCRKSFQAIRIEVNGELDAINKAVPDAFDLLNIGGRLAVISFHSLEDRIIKNIFKELTTGCICPPEFAVCFCHKKPKAKLLTRKPIIAGEVELKANPRSRSAKLRVVEKLMYSK